MRVLVLNCGSSSIKYELVEVATGAKARHGIVEEVTGALGGEGDTFTVCRDGRAVAGQVNDQTPDLAIFDLQIGTMGGMAVTMDLRLDESAGVSQTFDKL